MFFSLEASIFFCIGRRKKEGKEKKSWMVVYRITSRRHFSRKFFKFLWWVSLHQQGHVSRFFYYWKMMELVGFFNDFSSVNFFRKVFVALLRFGKLYSRLFWEIPKFLIRFFCPKIQRRKKKFSLCLVTPK